MVWIGIMLTVVVLLTVGYWGFCTHKKWETIVFAVVLYYITFITRLFFRLVPESGRFYEAAREEAILVLLYSVLLAVVVWFYSEWVLAYGELKKHVDFGELAKITYRLYDDIGRGKESVTTASVKKKSVEIAGLFRENCSERELPSAMKQYKKLKGKCYLDNSDLTQVKILKSEKDLKYDCWIQVTVELPVEVTNRRLFYGMYKRNMRREDKRRKALDA